MNTLKRLAVAIALVSGVGICATAPISTAAETPIVVPEDDGIHECGETWTETETRTGTRIEQETYTYEVEEEYEVDIPDEVIEDTYYTEYHFRKFTRSYTPAVEAKHYSWTGHWRLYSTPPGSAPGSNWQPNTSQEPHTNGGGNPATWVNDNLHYTANGHLAEFGTASWFYFIPGTDAVYGEWDTQYDTHQSWELSPDPLGSPAPHPDGQWQARWDGQTREVSNEDGYTIPGYTETRTRTVEREVVRDVEVEYTYDVEVEYVAGWECPPPPTTEPPVPTTQPKPEPWIPPHDPCIIDGIVYDDGFKLGVGDANDRKGTTDLFFQYCYIEVPNPAPPVVATPPTAPPPPQALPATGSDYTDNIAVGAIVAFLAGATLLALSRRRKVTAE